MGTSIGSYDEWVQSLQAKGLKTTRLGNGEANFSDYGNALSTELQQQILDSFDTEADKELQAQIAALFTDGNVESRSAMISKCQQMGINVSTSYVQTTYISDNKADGHYDTDARNGSITLYTFSDGKGGEFTVADANGNGYLETEELFINEILTGVASDIAVDASKNVAGSSSSGGSHSSSGLSLKDLKDKNSLADFFKELREKADKTEETEENTSSLEAVSTSTFESLVKELAKTYQEEFGFTNSQAQAKAEDTISKEYVVQ